MLDMHEFLHPSGILIRVPRRYFLGKCAPNEMLELADDTHKVEFPIAIFEDISAYLKALAWYEGDAMTPASPDWPKFIELLKGEDGINLKPEWEDKKARARGPFRYSCSCAERPDDWKWDGESIRWPKATAILKKHFARYDMHDSLAYWMLYKADCDCLVAFNIDGVLTTGFSRMIRNMLDKKHSITEPSQAVP